MLARFLLLMSAPASAALAQGFEYAPGTTRYRITQTSKITQEMMGQKQEGQSLANQFLTVTISRAARDTIAAVLVLDSITSSNSMGVPTPSLDRFQGLTVNARLSPSGHVIYSTAGPKEEEIPSSTEITSAMVAFLPRVRARLARGASWADTVTGKAKQFGLDVDRRVITRHVVVGDTVVAGEAAWTLARSDTATVSGSGVATGGAMTMEGSSSSKSRFYLTKKGVFAGGEGTEDGTIRLVVSANGMEVAVTTSSTTKVQRVQ